MCVSCRNHVTQYNSEWHDYVTHVGHYVTFCHVVNTLYEALHSADEVLTIYRYNTARAHHAAKLHCVHEKLAPCLKIFRISELCAITI